MLNFEKFLVPYAGWEVLNSKKIKSKYGYIVVLQYREGEIRQQKSGFESKKLADKAREITIAELYSRQYIVCENIKLDEFLLYWLEKVKRPDMSHQAYMNYYRIITKHINASLGKLKINMINQKHLSKLYSTIAETSYSYCKTARSIMKNAFAYALSKNFLKTNVALLVKLPKQVVDDLAPFRTRIIKSENTYTLEQLNTLLYHAKGTKIYLHILFAVLLGLRVSEIIGVKYSDVDFNKRTIKISRQLGYARNSAGKKFKKKTKTKQEIPTKTQSSIRGLMLPDLLYDAIIQEQKVYEKNRSRRIKTFRDDEYIVCSTSGIPRCRTYHWSLFKDLIKKAELPDISFHHLRSSYATLLLKNDLNVKAVSKVLGHAKEIITVDVYGDMEKIIEDCVDAIEPFIYSVLPIELARECYWYKKSKEDEQRNRVYSYINEDLEGLTEGIITKKGNVETTMRDVSEEYIPDELINLLIAV